MTITTLTNTNQDFYLLALKAIICTAFVLRLRFSSDADIVRLTNAHIIIIIIIYRYQLLPPCHRQSIYRYN